MNFDFSMQDFVYLVISMGLFLISGSLHEFGHASAAYIQGDTTARDNGRLTINPAAHIDIFGSIVFPLFSAISGFRVFGWMRPVPVYPLNFKNPSKGQAITSIAGPFSNFIQLSFGLILLKLLLLISTLFVSYGLVFSHLFTVIYLYARINLTLMIFNLIPSPPLDGGWILRHFLPDGFKHVYDRIYPFGIFILYFLLYAGVIRIILAPFDGFLSSLVYSQLFSINIALVSLPFLLSVSIVYLFLREDIHAFIRRKRFQENFISGQKEHIAIKEETKKQNVSLINSFDSIINKVENKEKLNSDDEEFINKLEKEANKDANLCDEMDFDIEDEHCSKCDTFFNCLLRKIRKILSV